jgi:hypothetical protein
VAGVRTVIIAVGFVVAALAIYVANGEFIGSYDSLPNSLLVLNAAETGRLDFDRFRNGYFRALGAQYAFVEAPDGHLTSVFPIGTAIVTAPIYAAFAIARAADPAAPPLTSPAAEPERRRDEKFAAALIAALAVGLCWCTARFLGTPFQAAIATAVFAVCTPMWSIASQALWQHGPVNLAVLAAVYALLRAGRSAGVARVRWVALAGIVAGLLPVIRPTALVFSLAAAAVVWAAQRPRAGWFAGGVALGIAPGLAWNLIVFHALAGGYGVDARAFGADLPRTAGAFAGLLISPSRGLFIFAPVLVFAIAGAVRAARRRERDDGVLLAFAAASVALTLVYAFFPTWWAGYTYGPRFLSDVAGIASLLLIGVIPPALVAARRTAAATFGAVAFATAAFASLVIQFAGANGGAAGSDWNAVPVSVDLAPERVWDLRDTQIRRNVLGAYYRFFPPAAAAPAAASVVGISAEPRQVGATTYALVRATVAEAGGPPLFGYASGRYAGQVRVRVHVTDADGTPVSDQLLYVADRLAPGERRTAAGLIRIPLPPARYRVVCEPMVVGGAIVRDRAPFVARLGGTPI